MARRHPLADLAECLEELTYEGYLEAFREIHEQIGLPSEEFIKAYEDMLLRISQERDSLPQQVTVAGTVYSQEYGF